MNKRMTAVVLAALMILTAALSVEALAGEAGFEIRGSDTIGSVLERHVGKRVELKLASGESVSGTVGKVEQLVVHVERLVGKDFYDAVVRIDGIDAVVFRAREK
jgi:hypothetical protein